MYDSYLGGTLRIRTPCVAGVHQPADGRRRSDREIAPDRRRRRLLTGFHEIRRRHGAGTADSRAVVHEHRPGRPRDDVEEPLHLRGLRRLTATDGQPYDVEPRLPARRSTGLGADGRGLLRRQDPGDRRMPLAPTAPASRPAAAPRTVPPAPPRTHARRVSRTPRPGRRGPACPCPGDGTPRARPARRPARSRP